MDKIQIVLASPSDLQKERIMIKQLTDKYNSLYIKHDICIDLRMWENVSPGMNDNGAQGHIDLDLEIPKADIFICLYWKRIGTMIEPESVAGTEHELKLAINAFQVNHKPDVKVYFKEIPPSDMDPSNDLLEIRRIEKQMQPLGLYTKFKDLEDLQDLIGQMLSDVLLKKIRMHTSLATKIRNTNEINSTKDFVEFISSNSNLAFGQGIFDVLDFSNQIDNSTTLTRKEVFDGFELIIHDISNLTISGDHTTIIAQPRYASVLNFVNCDNISLVNLTIGHTPYKGYCMGSVLKLENCNNVKLNALELYGCGTYGIELHNCKNVLVNGSKIFECSYGALKISDSDLKFENSSIFDCNRIPDSLISSYSSSISLDNVSICHNHIDTNIFLLSDSQLYCRGVSVYNNSFSELSNEQIPFGISLYNNNRINSRGIF